jgi:hypothetical protein
MVINSAASRGSHISSPRNWAAQGKIAMIATFADENHRAKHVHHRQAAAL